MQTECLGARQVLQSCQGRESLTEDIGEISGRPPGGGDNSQNEWELGRKGQEGFSKQREQHVQDGGAERWGVWLEDSEREGREGAE